MRYLLLALCLHAFCNTTQANAVEDGLRLDVPAPVLEMLAHRPQTADVESRADKTDREVARAIYNAERWLRIVIDPRYLPHDVAPVCIRNEFDNRDVVRWDWEANKHSLRVAQTASIFAMEIKPTSERLPNSSKAARLEAARRICGEFLKKTGERWTGRGERIAVPSLNTKILEWSFDPANTVLREDRSRLVGRPKSMTEEGVSGHSMEPRPPDAIEHDDWHRSPQAWIYWFRNVFWFSDDDRVVLYFLMQDGGPIVLFFDGALDRDWF